VVELIRNQEADYLLGLKKNQGTLFAEVENFFTQVLSMNPEEWSKECNCDYFVSDEKSRNRQEKREVFATSDLNWLPQKAAWGDLNSLVCVRSERILNRKRSIERRFYISSMQADAELQGKGI
jgi:hypothetical protein